MSRAHRINLGGLDLIPDMSGALYVPDFSALIAADLHFEKGSSLAKRGVHLPPYDTRETLGQLEAAIAQVSPKRLILLGDSFHDRHARERIAGDDVARLVALTSRIDIVWITGNHDPLPPRDLGGTIAEEIALGPLSLRHEPSRLAEEEYEIAGHLHPAAALSQRGRQLRCRCFAGDGRRLVMPAFGAFTGGLDVRDEAFMPVFPTGEFFVWMIGSRAIHRFPSSRVR
ncbi:ligase-associated DNA damage response endonuclease PdeM [soil metagenome]